MYSGNCSQRLAKMKRGSGRMVVRSGRTGSDMVFLGEKHKL
jgi:hypothetical protein